MLNDIAMWSMQGGLLALLRVTAAAFDGKALDIQARASSSGEAPHGSTLGGVHRQDAGSLVSLVRVS